MLKLMEKLRELDVDMRVEPLNMWSETNILVLFTKNIRGVSYHKSHMFGVDDLRKLQVNIEDMLVDMVDKFMKDIEERRIE